MTKSDNQNGAFGQPGIHPRWTHGGKDGIGTAYAASSRIWFSLWNGIITEVYYPTVDRPQLRDLQYLITDGKSFFHDDINSSAYLITRWDTAARTPIPTGAMPSSRKLSRTLTSPAFFSAQD
jgi:GH15 family glucan-1,4-alpha-glucosidase